MISLGSCGQIVLHKMYGLNAAFHLNTFSRTKIGRIKTVLQITYEIKKKRVSKEAKYKKYFEKKT